MSTSHRIWNVFAQVKSLAGSAWSAVRRNPICGIKLETGAKCVAIILMAVSVLILVAVANLCLSLVGRSEVEDSDSVPVASIKIEVHPSRFACGVLLVYLFVVAAPEFVLSAFLYSGIKKGNYTIVNRCWMVMAFIAVADIVFTIIMSIALQEILVELMEVFTDVLYIYSVLVVYCYKEELKRGADLGQSQPSGDSAGDFQRFV